MVMIVGMLLSAPLAVLVFYVLISSEFSNVVAFVALTISCTFMGISMWLLGWILE